MKSLRKQFIRSYIGAILIAFAAETAISVYHLQKAIETNSSKALSFLAQQKASELNETFSSVEQAAIILEDYITNNVNLSRLKTDAQYAENFSSDFAQVATQLCKILKYVKTFYFCPDPELFPHTRCTYYLNNGFNYYMDFSFDIGSYDPDDISHTAPFYAPKKAGHSTWIGPYRNANTENAMNTITYAIPMHSNGKFWGTVGLEISEAVLRKSIDNIDYDASFGFLFARDGSLIYHKDFPGGLSIHDFNNFSNTKVLQNFFSKEYINTGKNYKYTWFGVKQRLILNQIENGMVLAISVPEDELLKQRTQMLFQLLITLVFTLLITVLLANNLASRVIRPLQNLTETTSRIARGELNAEIPYHSNNELGALAESIRKISIELKEYISYIQNQAYTDVMTGSRNKTAYIDRVKILEKRVSEDIADFTIYVFDVNGLKHMNDCYGHEYGDMLIKDAANILLSVFPENSVYRTGGDEFVVIDENITEEQINKNFEKFDKNLEAFNKENEQYDAELAISKGAAIYNKDKDRDFKSVFDRADKAMYACKKEFYSMHMDRRRR